MKAASPSPAHRRLGRILMLSLMLAAMPAAACSADFSTTNVQILYGGNFHDRYFGYNTVDGRLTTVTLEHFDAWAYGDNFFFVDFISGDFADFQGRPTGKRSRIYGEWHPRLSLSRLSGRDLSYGIVRDIFVAGQINRDGEGFRANMLGLGANLGIPGFRFVELDVYARKDNFNRPTWQATLAWNLAFGALPMTLGGYVDINGTDNHGIEINGQPQLLLDVGALAGAAGERLMLGLEWYFHRHRNIHSSVPQMMAQWTF